MNIVLANEILKEKQVSVKFTSAIQILENIKKSWHKNNWESESDLLEELYGADVLIIDDFGLKLKDDGWMAEKLYSIVNVRYLERP